MKYFNKDILLEAHDKSSITIQRRFPRNLFDKIEKLIGKNTEKILIMCRTETDVKYLKHCIKTIYKKQLSDRILVYSFKNTNKHNLTIFGVNYLIIQYGFDYDNFENELNQIEQMIRTSELKKIFIWE